jgi:hypothetical protein
MLVYLSLTEKKAFMRDEVRHALGSKERGTVSKLSREAREDVVARFGEYCLQNRLPQPCERWLLDVVRSKAEALNHNERRWLKSNSTPRRGQKETPT